MNFFDSLIDDAEVVINGVSKKEYAYGKKWSDAGRNELVLMRDAAFELDGIGFNLITTRDIGESGVTVAGPELSEIKNEKNFARISVIRMEEFDDEQKLYDTIRKVEYSKYHYFPKGFMIRTASTFHKEAVRVSKQALKNGISFEQVGNLLIEKYLQNPAVISARIIYVTDSSVDFEKLKGYSEKNYEITETLNHIMKNLKFDCAACNLKPICDEVEGMRELHFKKSGAMA